MELASGKDLDGLPRYRGVHLQGFRARSLFAIEAFASRVGNLMLAGEIIELGVSTSSTDQGGTLREVFQND